MKSFQRSVAIEAMSLSEATSLYDPEGPEIIPLRSISSVPMVYVRRHQKGQDGSNAQPMKCDEEHRIPTRLFT
jgi:hypothetical protein